MTFVENQPCIKLFKVPDISSAHSFYLFVVGRDCSCFKDCLLIVGTIGKRFDWIEAPSTGAELLLQEYNPHQMLGTVLLQKNRKRIHTACIYNKKTFWRYKRKLVKSALEILVVSREIA